MLVSRRSGAQRRKSCLKLGFDGEPDRNSEFCCQNRSDSIFRPRDNIIRNRRRIELNFNCRAVISHFQRFSFYCVCGSSMITMKVDNHGGNETKTIRVTVMGLWAFFHVSIFPTFAVSIREATQSLCRLFFAKHRNPLIIGIISTDR